ncbi:unnamed protein product [Brassica oleracea]
MKQSNRLMPQHLNIRQNLASLQHKLFHSCSTCTTSCLIRTNHHPLHGITNGKPSAILNAELLSTTSSGYHQRSQWSELSAYGSSGAEQSDIHAVEALLRELLHRVLAPRR